MKRILWIAIAVLCCLSFTLAAAPAKKAKVPNPFKNHLKKIEKIQKDIKKAEEKNESTEKKDALKDKLEKAEEKLAKAKEKETKRVEKKIEDLEKQLEKAGDNEKKKAALTEQLDAAKRFLKSIPTWAEGDEPSADELE